MKKFLLFNLKHPKLMLLSLFILTIPAIWGIGQLRFDSSIEVLMPEIDQNYQLGQKVRDTFGDNKTFTIVSVESRLQKKERIPASNKSSAKISSLGPVFEPEIFQQLAPMIYELKEYKEFDKLKEDKRFSKLLSVLNVTEIDSRNSEEIKTKENRPAQIASNKKNFLLKNSKNEEDLDEMILQSGSAKDAKKNSSPQSGEETVKQNIASTNPKVSKKITGEKDLDDLILNNMGKSPEQTREKSTQNGKESKEKDFNKTTQAGERVTERKNLEMDLGYWKRENKNRNYGETEAIRERKKYNYNQVKKINKETLLDQFSGTARNQLLTIMRYHGMQEYSEEQILSKQDIKKVVESWEDLYLLKSKEIVKNLVDPISVEDISGSKGELKPQSLLPENDDGSYALPKNDKEFAAYYDKLQKNPLYKDSLYSLDENGKVRALGLYYILRPQKDLIKIREYLWHLVQKYDQGPVKLYVMGTTIINKFMNDHTQKDLAIFLPLVILVVIITFYLNFHSIRGVLLPTLTVLLATLWTMGIMGFLQIPVTIIGSITPILLIAVGSSYAIHIFNQYLLDLNFIKQNNKQDALLTSLSNISTTVMLAGATTFIGFSTLAVNQVRALREFGIFAAIGTLLSVYIAVVLISASLMLLPNFQRKTKKGENSSIPSREEEGNMIVRNMVHFFSFFSTKYSGSVIAVIVVTMAVGIWGTTQMTTETTAVKYFLENSYINVANKKISHLFNGTFVFDLVIDSGKRNGAKDPNFLNFISSLQNWLNQTEQKEKYYILHNTSFTDIIQRMHKAMHNDDHAYYTIPASKTTIEEYLEIFSGKDGDSDGRADVLEGVIDSQYRYVNIPVRIGNHGGQDVGTRELNLARNHIRKHLAQFPNPDQYHYAIVGTPLNFITLSGYIVRGQVATIILSVLIVAFIIFILFQNPFAGLVALLPISVSVIIVFGFMGFAKIPLDIAQAILSSVAIGIGVDDTIHFLNTLRKKLCSGLSLQEAIHETHHKAGLAIVYTSVALIFGFSVMMFSSFRPVVYFGFLVSSVMLSTTIGALLVLPSVINFFHLPLAKQYSMPILKKWNLGRCLEDKNPTLGNMVN